MSGLLVVMGLLGCPDQSGDKHSSDTEVTPHDTGWALYEAPGQGWSGLQEIEAENTDVALNPDGLVTFSGCEAPARCDDGACRRDCSNSAGWWDALGPLEMVVVPAWGREHWTHGMPEPWLVVDATGTTWRRTDSESPTSYEVAGWSDPTSVGAIADPSPGWCAAFADRPAACDRDDGEVDPELLDHVAGATRFASSGADLAFIREDGSAGFTGTSWYDLYGSLPESSYSAVSILGLNILATDTDGALGLYYYGVIDNDDPVASALSFGPEPTDVAVFAAGNGLAQCWVDQGGQLHFAWLDWDPDAEPEWMSNRPLVGPTFAAVPTEMTCSEEAGCAIVEGKLQCWALTWDGTPTITPFSDLMLTSGTRLQ